MVIKFETKELFLLQNGGCKQKYQDNVIEVEYM